MTLRGALSMKTADAFRAVYCWQTVRCMELWARVLSDHVHTVRTALLPGRLPVAVSLSITALSTPLEAGWPASEKPASGCYGAGCQGQW